MWIPVLILICFFTQTSVSRSTPEDDSYMAAVVEYQMQSDLQTNLDSYVQLIAEAAEQDVDIVVFPELTLSSQVSVPVPLHSELQQHPVPASVPEMYHQILVIISEAAQAHQVYVVINVQEILDCSSNATEEFCPESRTYLFNTNVVFNREGAVIDRYRKINLFGEFHRTPALQADLGMFSTDFGVTFGHFICFDLKFQVPAVQLIEKYNVTDVVYPTMWYSEIPYLTAVQIQEAYAYTMNVNLLAAGANNVRVGSAGSGIYSGKAGSLISIMPGVPTTQLLVARVPKSPGSLTQSYPGAVLAPPSEHDDLLMLKDPSLTAHMTRLLDEGHQEFTLSHQDVTCSFRVHLTWRIGEKHYVYRASAFDGVRTYSGFASGGTRICSVFACTDSSIDSCGLRFDQYVENSTAIFEDLFIAANIPSPVFNTTLEAHDAIYFPISLDVYTMPLKPEAFTYAVQNQGQRTIFDMNLVDNDAELYGFAVWGRRFETDGQEPTAPLPEDDEVDQELTITLPEDDQLLVPEASTDSSVTNTFDSFMILVVISSFVSNNVRQYWR